MERLRNLAGHERSLGEISQVLSFAAQEMHAPVTGAMHVTCSDESENECVDAFQHGFVQHLLPSLKFARSAPFRTANLGGRYEWGSVRLAERHFCEPDRVSTFKLLVIKINAHVAYEPVDDRGGAGSTAPGGPAPFRLGRWKRYGRESACCGALAALAGPGNHEPHVRDLRETLGSEGRDRLAALLDERRVDPLYRPLYAGIVSARLQARQAVLDIQDYLPSSPTYYLIVPCVTVNRHERDTEILCGLYTVDTRSGVSGAEAEAIYAGLGDDPEAFTTRIEHGRFIVADDQVGQERAARNHRHLARSMLLSHGELVPLRTADERLQRVREDVERDRHKHNHHHARTLLRIALPILAEVAPVPVAILAFADGAAGIHHAWRVHKLAAEMQGTDEARQILDEIHDRIDELDADRAEALLELLVQQYRE
jgi:hypothetical protein